MALISGSTVALSCTEFRDMILVATITSWFFYVWIQSTTVFLESTVLKYRRQCNIHIYKGQPVIVATEIMPQNPH